MCKLRARSSLFAQFVELWLLGIEGSIYFSIEWFILLLSRSLSMLVLEFTKDQFILFLYFLSFFSDKLFKEVNKCENHTQRHWVSNKAKKLFFISFYFRVFVYFFFVYVLRCSYIFTFSVNEAHCSYLVPFIVQFLWYLFFLNHIIYTGFMKLTIFNVFLTLFVIAELIQLS